MDERNELIDLMVKAYLAMPDGYPHFVAITTPLPPLPDWRAPQRELTEDDKAIHRAIEHHQP